MHTTPTVRISSSLISTFRVHSPAFFSKTSPEFFLCLLWLTPVPVWAHRKDWSPCSSLGTIGAGSRVECPRNINRLQNICYCSSGFVFWNCWCNSGCCLRKTDSWYNDLWNELVGDRPKFVFSPDAVLCGWMGSKHQLATTCSQLWITLISLLAKDIINNVSNCLHETLACSPPFSRNTYWCSVLIRALSFQPLFETLGSHLASSVTTSGFSR